MNFYDKIRQQITKKAFKIYADRGFDHGADQQDWLRAEEYVLSPLSIEIVVKDADPETIDTFANIFSLQSMKGFCMIDVDSPGSEVQSAIKKISPVVTFVSDPPDEDLQALVSRKVTEKARQKTSGKIEDYGLLMAHICAVGKTETLLDRLLAWLEVGSARKIRIGKGQEEIELYKGMAGSLVREAMDMINDHFYPIIPEPVDE